MHKIKNRQIEEAPGLRLDPCTGAQYLLPRVYIVAKTMFHIEYNNAARNTKL